MATDLHSTRVDTLELKELIYRKIGHKKAEKYFDQLKRFLSMKLSKVEFGKSCIRTIGRENISIHNRLIRSIVQNACQSKVPPQKAQRVGLNVQVANGYQRNCLQSLHGDAFRQSPRRYRSPINRDCKFWDRPSPLGPLGKSPSTTYEETVTRTQEQQSATELHSLCSRPLVDAASVEDGEEVEQISGNLNVRRSSPVTAPFGISVNMVGARKARCRGHAYSISAETCQSGSELPDTKSLRSRLQKKLAVEGVGISLDCTKLLNNSLDVYLKRLIEPCIGIAGSQSTFPRQSNNQMTAGLNGVLPGRFAETLPQSKYVSLLDFHVAMESNPRILGEDWYIQLEKIWHYASGE